MRIFITKIAGIPDFRSNDGLYSDLSKKFNLEDPKSIFDIAYFTKDPSLFYSFGSSLCPGFNDNEIKYYPTPTHYFIKMLDSQGKLLRNYTQNVDTLEFKAGIRNVITCHGSFATASCISCQYQVYGRHIQHHLFTGKIPLCPYCHPETSDLKESINDMEQCKLRKHIPIVTKIDCDHERKIRHIRLPKGVCFETCLQKECPFLFCPDPHNINIKFVESNSEIIEQKENAKDQSQNGADFNYLVLESNDMETLIDCRDEIMRWMKTKIVSFGVIKPDITFFGESLKPDYESLLSKDINQCDLLLVIGTSLAVAPVSNIPNQLSSDIPAVLINREVVGNQYEFDVNLLGDCDDVCSTLATKLNWKLTTPQRNNFYNFFRTDSGHFKKHIVCNHEGVSSSLVKYKFVPPNNYIFPKGKLQQQSDEKEML